jgi:hypothetical protein
LGLKDYYVGFNFSFHFWQVFQIHLPKMPRYLTHLEKTTTRTSKKVRRSMFLTNLAIVVKTLGVKNTMFCCSVKALENMSKITIGDNGNIDLHIM